MMKQGRWRAMASPPEELRGASFVRFRANGDLWVADEGRLCLYRRSNDRWSAWRQDEPSPRNRVHEFLRASDGSIWVATAAGIEIHSPGGNVRYIDSVDARRELHDVTGLGEDDDGHIWIASGSSFLGAYRLDGSAWHLVGPGEGLPAGFIHRITRDRHGRLWFLYLTRGVDFDLGEGYGAYVYSHGVFEAWGPEKGLPSGRVYAFAEGTDGALWFGTQVGLSRYRNGRWRHWTAGKELQANPVFAIAVDSRNRVWFGDREHGLGTIDENDQPRYLTTADGLVSDEIWGLAVDPDDRLWIGTHAGLGCLHHGRWISFRAGAGLNSPHVWPILAGDNKLYVGTTGGGTNILNLNESQEPPRPRVTLEPPLVDDDQDYRVLVRWRVDTHWGETPPQHVETHHRIDGGTWSSWDTAREVSFKGLTAGRHRVEVEARDYLGDVPQQPEAADFLVDPPFYRRPAVVTTSLALAIVGLGVGAVLFTRRLRDLAALRRSEARYRGLFEEAPEIIFTLSDDGRLRSINRAGELALGYASGELVNKSLLELVAVEDRDAASSLVRDGARGESARRELTLVARDSRRVPVELGLRMVEEESPAPEFQVIARDVSERRRNEAERLAMERQLLEVQRLESLGVLAGGVAHDFNNLLLAILGNAELALMDVKPRDGAREKLERIATAASRAGELTQQLLAYAGKGRVGTQSIDLNALVRETADILRVSLPVNTTLCFELAPELPAVAADAGQMRQIVMNLILNAGDAIGDRRGTVTVRTRLVALVSPQPTGHRHPETLAPGEYVSLEVEDTGQGMSAETRARIFDPFFTTKFTGRGLGLAAVQGIVRGHGGAIAVASELGQGTRFTILLPAAPAPATAVTETHPRSYRGSGTVLVIDDEGPVREVVAEVLESLGFDVLAAEDGALGIDLYRAHAEGVRLVLVDRTMPGQSGEEVIAAIRNLKADAKILLMTGQVDSDGASAGLGVPLLLKPFKVDSLVRKLGEILGPG